MHIPVELGARRERGIDGGEEAGGEDGRHDRADEMVGERGEEELVDVERQRREREVASKGLDQACEERRRREREWVEHVLFFSLFSFPLFRWGEGGGEAGRVKRRAY